MGYNTHFTLRVDVGKGDDADKLVLSIIEDFRASCDGADYALDSEGNCEDCRAWYDYKRDLTKFSKKYPYAVFDLYGEGEEAGDLWHLYVKNGESVKAHVVTTFAPNPFTPTAINTSFIREVALSKLTDDEIESLGLTRSQEGWGA